VVEIQAGLNELVERASSPADMLELLLAEPPALVDEVALHEPTSAMGAAEPHPPCFRK
jgi:hypothetical protein